MAAPCVPQMMYKQRIFLETGGRLRHGYEHAAEGVWFIGVPTHARWWWWLQEAGTGSRTGKDTLHLLPCCALGNRSAYCPC